MLISEKDVQATMVDLSEGGMAILANYSVPASTVLLMRFTLFRVNKEDVSFYRPISITGEVRYNTMIDKDLYRIGICFTKIEEKDRCEISDFVKMTSNISKMDNKGH